MAVRSAAKVQVNAKDKRLGGYLKRARQRANSAPAAARADRSTRESYKKGNKADAFGMSKY